MKLITIQHKSVLEKLMKKGEYRANYKRVSENIVKPYQFMQKHFSWKSCPIFLAPVGHYVELGGAKFDRDCIAIELDIPDDLCKVQLYYDWSDFIYFDEFPNEFGNSFDLNRFKDVKEWAKTILDRANHKTYNIKDADKNEDALQVSVEMLKREWVTDTTENLSKLNDKHNLSGGSSKLKELKYYK